MAAAEAQKKEEETKKAAENKPQATGSGPIARSSERSQEAASTQLPQTGAFDVAASFVGMMAIIGAGYYYYHFNRQ